MTHRVLHFRLAFVVLGVFAMIAGGLMEQAWLAVAGAVAAAVGEVIGLVRCTARYSTPAARTMRGSAEALPAVGISVFDPWALGITVAVVVYTLLGNGMHTVSVARGVDLKRTQGETLRRVATALAGLLVLTVPVSVATGFDVAARLSSTNRALIVVGFAIVVLAGVRGLTDMALGLRRD